MSVRVTQDNTAAVKAKIKDGIRKALMECGEAVVNEAKSTVPVDTGRLKRSITAQMEGDNEVQIGTDIFYGKYVECGTSRMGARPYLKPAATNNVGKFEQAFKNAIS